MHWIKSRLPPTLRKVLELSQRFGANVTPNHFYSEIPSLKSLKSDTRWRAPFSMAGVNGVETGPQLAYLRDTCAPFQQQLHSGALADVYQRANTMNGEPGYGPIEAEFLYCFFRRHKPRRIIQVGCGVTTALALIAAEDEPGYKPEITCIEPYPTELLRKESAAGRIVLRAEPAQATPLDVFTRLEPGDLFFIDSTHTVKPGSEVTRMILDVMPRLKPGVLVHFHDIYFPYDYHPSTLGTDPFFWRETVLLLAMLTMNQGYEICTSMAMLHHAEQNALKDVFKDYKPAQMNDGLFDFSKGAPGHFPCSIILRRV